MAIITDYDDQPTSPSKSRSKSKPKSKSELESSKPKPDSKRPTQTPSPNPFTFWFYFTVIVSVITFFFISVPTFSTPDPKTWFLKLPTSLRIHYFAGRVIKVQVNPGESQIDVFTYSKGVRESENVLIIHGLGCSSFSFKGIVDRLGLMGLFGVAIDLPGSGFSEKAVEREEERITGSNGVVFRRVFEVYEEIKENGFFWGFDSLIEHGHLPYDEINTAKNRVSKRKVVVPLDLGADEVGRVIGQVVEVMGLAPFHLVLHDSALVMVGNWVVENSGLIRSVTLLDSLPQEVALPLRVFEVPVLREVILRVDFVFGRLISTFCSRGVSGSSVEGHRVLLKGRDGGEAIVGMWKKLNHSFDLGEWVSLDGMKGMPMQVVWSGSWSKEWSEEGKRVAEVVSRDKFITHSGGKWPQDTSSEIAENIFSFVSSLPKTERKADNEPLPEHIQKKLDEAKAEGHDHHHGANAGYMDAYGLGGHGNGHAYGM